MLKKMLKRLADMFVTATIVVAILTAAQVYGCGFLEHQAGNALSDLDGWDLSACVESGCGRETCLQLFLDNDRMILGGRSAAEALLEGLQDLNSNG